MQALAVSAWDVFVMKNGFWGAFLGGFFGGLFFIRFGSS